MKSNTRYLKFIGILTFLALVIEVNSVAGRRSCVCQSKYGQPSGLCAPLKKSTYREVIMVHEGKSNYKDWQWDTITAVLSTNDSYNDEVMCYAHLKDKQYGIIEHFPSTINMTDPVFSQWMDKIHKRFNDDLIVDLIAFDLLDLLGDCQRTQDETADDVIHVIKTIFDSIKKGGSIQILCIVPYKPPCFEQDCKYLTSHLLAKQCDMVITSPESYITFCDLNCKARATVPETKLVTGVDEYLSSGVSEKKMLIGIPWHGYDYKCFNFVKKPSGQSDVCEVDTLNGSKICDFGPNFRTKLSFAAIGKKFPKMVGDHQWSNLYKAPYFSYTEAKKGQNVTHHQVWFEASDSLLQKYLFAKLMGIRGVVVWSADDLANAGPGIHENDNNGKMWAWLLHAGYLSDDTPVHDISIAGKMAAAGVGCFLVGTAIGVLVTCVVSRTRGIKRRQPFALDEDESDVYHDDDNVL